MQGLDYYRASRGYNISDPKKPLPPLYNPHVLLDHKGVGEIYNDDNIEVLQGLKRAHRNLHDPELLRILEQNFALILKSHDPRGGEMWKEQMFKNTPKSRAANTNVPIPQIALYLWKETENDAYLQEAIKSYEWVEKTFKDKDGLIRDNINDKNVVSTGKKWIYNQGDMIASGILLFHATKDKKYLKDAEATARAALQNYPLSECINGEPTRFMAVYYRSLLYLCGTTQDADLVNDIKQSLYTYLDTVSKDKRIIASNGTWHEVQPMKVSFLGYLCKDI